MKALKWSALSFALFILNLVPSILTGYFAVKTDFTLAITAYIVFVQLFILGIFIYLVIQERFVDRNSFKLNWRDWKFIGILFFFQGCLSFIFEMLERMTALTTEEVDIFAAEIHPTPLIITFVSSVLLSPLVEEHIFRGILLDRVFHRNWFGVIISSVFFGLAHLPSSPYSALAFILPGILFSYTYIKTGRLTYTIIVHFINNLLAFIFLII